MSYLFKIPSTGFSRIMLLGTIFSIIGVTVMQVLEIKSLKLLYVARPLHWALLLIPFYSLTKGIYDISSIYSFRKLCGSVEDSCQKIPEWCCGKCTNFLLYLVALEVLHLEGAESIFLTTDCSYLNPVMFKTL